MTVSKKLIKLEKLLKKSEELSTKLVELNNDEDENEFFNSTINSKKKLVCVTGKINGSISYRIRGKKGFGYDPIFIPSKKLITFGQMIKKKKIKMDHRYIAFKKLKNKIKIL